MDTSKLMLGDLVMFYGCVSRIDGLWQDIAHIEGEPEEQYAYMHEIEPIPLTAEILEANGWTLLANLGGGEAYWSDNGEFNIPYNKGQYRIIIHGIVIKITYVHELQRVLRCCGRTGIADNFKIK